MVESIRPKVIRKAKVDGHRASDYEAWSILTDEYGNEWMNASKYTGIFRPRVWYRYEDIGYNTVQVERQRSIGKWLRTRKP